ncbi:MAG: hypothetical protein WC378_01305 [Opitutaceae bacterium]|jgi:hypothetical protein
MHTFRATAQADVFFCVETNSYFPHDGEHPLSEILGYYQQAGLAVIEPYTPETYADFRRATFQQKIGRDEFMEAFFEWIEGRPEKAQALLARRAEIKAAFPKPPQ